MRHNAMRISAVIYILHWILAKRVHGVEYHFTEYEDESLAAVSRVPCPTEGRVLEDSDFIQCGRVCARTPSCVVMDYQAPANGSGAKCAFRPGLEFNSPLTNAKRYVVSSIPRIPISSFSSN